MKCVDCGENLADLPNLPEGEKLSCPNCGSMFGVLKVLIREEIKLSDHSALLGKRNEKSKSFRESIRDGRLTAADENNDGTFSFLLLGSSPQGEEDTLSVCRILVEVLNNSGENWDSPLPGQGIVDCEATDTNTRHQLNIQVTRAIIDQDFWMEISQKQGIKAKLVKKEDLVEYIRKSIENKASDRAIPPDSRKDITLALDATRLPVLLLDGVIKEFKLKYGHWSKTLGFNSIWLVGPQPDMVRRLDGT
jgi:DNA-directed RNA polymerase subunit RPC12/RpoP